ncbi:iron ABC transporter permease [Altererythrobacter sp. KTW20L]|uniref:FecCD family ABC transporter permease n=1 Tax=Altererythrobacter sp. KTW20L TaxID=2942210 RepID=UPI0020C0A92F|nr:iron ABC transporter permease [Altererythrobacter sp. KTW20L]MCL6251567.1 iron ABC transporter permease [Altererythrobacter sp. KTW20L]
MSEASLPSGVSSPRNSRTRAGLTFAVLAVLVTAAFALSMAIGPAAANLSALFGQLTGGEADTAILIMREIRLPRALLALLIGATLGASGAALQGLLRNPLAEPGVIGISSAAALGAVIALYTGLSVAVPLALPLLAITGALLAVLVLQLLSGGSSVLTLILAGVAISSLAGALTSLALNLSPNPFAAQEIVFWMMGSLTDRSLVYVGLAAPFIVVGLVLLLGSARSLEALTLGEEAAVSMGVDLGRLRWMIVLGTALSVGAATAVAGVIGFVGLVVPHLLRPLVGHRPAYLLPVSALGGALLLLVADIAVRLVTPGAELKLGVLTALVGAPFFMWLVVRSRSGRVG